MKSLSPIKLLVSLFVACLIQPLILNAAPVSETAAKLKDCRWNYKDPNCLPFKIQDKVPFDPDRDRLGPQTIFDYTKYFPDRFIDEDHDGYPLCNEYMVNNCDCDDTNSSVHPHAKELCDSIDNNCVNNADENFPTLGSSCSVGVGSCASDGVLVCGTDQLSVVCNAIPADPQSEICGDGIDQDCNGSDLDCNDADLDDDGFSTNQGDCNDNDKEIHPGATEICDGVDNNCVDGIDEPGAEGSQTWYEDFDHDTYGNPEITVETCTQPEGYVSNNLDCVDTDELSFPRAREQCGDELDNNCDEVIDEGCVGDANTDDDGDGWTENDGDCRDDDALIHPQNTEICYDDIDQDCDLLVDEGCVGDLDVDDDNDGFTENEGDCDDSQNTVFPQVFDLCLNQIDDDCDLVPDDGCVGLDDVDDDGDNMSEVDGDCNDNDSAIFTGAPETCETRGIDNDCDGDKLEPTLDSDNDQVSDCDDACPLDGDKTSPGVCGCGVADADSDNDTVVDCQDNCPLDAEKVEPGICGCGVADIDSDNDSVLDCNDQCPNDSLKTEPGTCGCGLSDDHFITWYEDTDSDQYGDPLHSQDSCTQPVGYVSNSDDCNDGDPLVHPTVFEDCDGIDNNCDGFTDEDVSNCFDGEILPTLALSLLISIFRERTQFKHR